MAKEINIARLAVDMVANTATYRSQLAELVKETDSRLKQLEKVNGTSNKKINADDAKAAKQAERIAKEKAKLVIEQAKREQREIAAIQRQKEKDLQTASKKTRAIVQQTGFQLQDVAVQAQAGIDGSIIVAQQGSQLLGAFGPLGAVLGAALAIGSIGFGVLSTAISGAKVQTVELSDAIKGLDKNFDKLNYLQQGKLIEAVNAQLRQQKTELDKLGTARDNANFDVSVQKSITGPDYYERVAEAQKLATSATVNYYNAEAKLFALEKEAAGLGTTADEYAEEAAALAMRLTEFGKTEKALAVLEARRKKYTDAQIKGIEFLYDEIEATRQAQEESDKVAATNKARLAQEERARANAQRSINETIQKLKIKNEEYGKGGSALAAYRIGLKGATDAQKEEIIALTKSLELKRQNTQLNKDAVDQATRLAGLDKTQTSEVERLAEEQKQLQSNYDKKLISEEAYLQALNGLRYRYTELGNAELTKLDRQRQKDLNELNEVAAKANINLKATEVEQIANLGISLTDDSSNALKALFAAQQIAAMTAGVMNTEEAATKALAIDPTGVLSLNARIQGYAGVAVIAAQTLGAFHGGTDEIPSHLNNKSFMLKAGERVVQPEANKKLTKFLDSENISSTSGSGAMNVVQNINGSAMMTKSDFDNLLARSSREIAGLNNKESRKRASTSKRLGK